MENKKFGAIVAVMLLLFFSLIASLPSAPKQSVAVEKLADMAKPEIKKNLVLPDLSKNPTMEERFARLEMRQDAYRKEYRHVRSSEFAYSMEDPLRNVDGSLLSNPARVCFRASIILETEAGLITFHRKDRLATVVPCPKLPFEQ
jgi:hypothetical protein